MIKMEKSYYAVERSSDSLAHYGVKGMRWGVRKAIASGSDKKMARAYKKAHKRLKKLQTRANIEAQKANVNVQRKKAIRAGVGSVGAGAAAYGLKKISNADKGIASLTYTNALLDSHKYGLKPSMNFYGDRIKKYSDLASNTNTAHQLSGLTSVGLAAKSGYHAGKAIASKYRTTKKGHARAVAKANAWKSEMDKAFAGTKYAANRKRSKKRRNIT